MKSDQALTAAWLTLVFWVPLTGEWFSEGDISERETTPGCLPGDQASCYIQGSLSPGSNPSGNLLDAPAFYFICFLVEGPPLLDPHGPMWTGSLYLSDVIPFAPLSPGASSLFCRYSSMILPHALCTCHSFSSWINPPCIQRLSPETHSQSPHVLTGLYLMTHSSVCARMPPSGSRQGLGPGAK